MEKGNYGYIENYKKKLLLGIIVLGVMIIFGVSFTLVMFGTKRSAFIVLPILLALPFAKLFVSYLMVASYKALSKDEHNRVVSEVSYGQSPDMIFDVTLSQYEGMTYFPAVVVRDGRMLFYYNGTFGKKIADKEALKKVIQKTFENERKPYVVIVATSLDEFIKKANGIKAADDEYAVKDKRVRQKIFEAGV